MHPVTQAGEKQLPQIKARILPVEQHQRDHPQVDVIPVEGEAEHHNDRARRPMDLVLYPRG
jgi:hypothetical protein